MVLFVGAGRTSQRWDCGMSGMLSRQSFLLHSSLLPWKLFESRPQMMLPRVHFAGLWSLEPEIRAVMYVTVAAKSESANQQVRLEKTTYSRGMQSLYLWSALISRDVTSLCIGCSRCSAHQSRFAKDISFQDFGPHNFGREHNCNLDRVELEEWEAKRLWGPLWPHAPLNLTNNLLMSMAASEQWQRNGEI